MFRWFLLLALPLYVIDQITKEAIVRRFRAPTEGAGIDGVVVIDGFFNIVRVHNTGVAFGRFNGATHANLIFGFIAAAALAAIVVLWRRGAFPGLVSKTAATLLVSGIIGNLTDRLFRGYVVDFLDFDLGFMRWPSFNVADSCITVAAVLLFFSAFQGASEPDRPAVAADSDREPVPGDPPDDPPR